jgi:hypothetical protein
MRRLSFMIFFLPIVAFSQYKYVAGYEQTMPLDFSNVPVEIKGPVRMDLARKDSLSVAVGDSLMKELREGHLLQKMIRKQFGDEVTLYVHVKADASYAELEINTSGMLRIHANSIYENGFWRDADENADSAKHRYLKDTAEFFFTGKTKQMLGYPCHELKSKDSTAKVTFWVCKDLPASISPGSKPHNINWAVFEYLNEQNKVSIILRSLRVKKIISM